MYNKATTQQELYLEESWKAESSLPLSGTHSSLGGEDCAVLRPAKRLRKNVGREVPRNTIRETKNIHSLRGLGLNEGRKRGRVHQGRLLNCAFSVHILFWRFLSKRVSVGVMFVTYRLALRGLRGLTGVVFSYGAENRVFR